MILFVLFLDEMFCLVAKLLPHSSHTRLGSPRYRMHICKAPCMIINITQQGVFSTLICQVHFEYYAGTHTSTQV